MIRITLDDLVRIAQRTYGYPADAIRATLDETRKAFERVEETTIPPDHMTPSMGLAILDAYHSMPHDT